MTAAVFVGPMTPFRGGDDRRPELWSPNSSTTIGTDEMEGAGCAHISKSQNLASNPNALVRISKDSALAQIPLPFRIVDHWSPLWMMPSQRHLRPDRKVGQGKSQAQTYRRRG
ncbi:MAG: hypothetical protein H6817_05650 [Phycisphaerales bacterium]|nr:hypothetical protein [Phycisphaerales bacterium]